MGLLDVRKEIDDKLRYLPEWIDTKSFKHKQVWDLIEYSHEILFILIVNMILSDKAIVKITKRFDDFMTEICEILDGELQVLLNIYFLSVVEYMTLVCLENEEYEAATNLRNFNSLYFQENINNVDEK